MLNMHAGNNQDADWHSPKHQSVLGGFPSRMPFTIPKTITDDYSAFHARITVFMWLNHAEYKAE